MIHTFTSCDKYMALDVGSGAVHALDELAYDVLRLHEQGAPFDEIRAQLGSRYGADELEETIGEIEELIRLGQLDTDDDYAELDVNTDPGVVKAMCLLVTQDCNCAASIALPPQANTTCMEAA